AVRARAQASEATAERVPVCLVGRVLQKLFQQKTMHILFPILKNRCRAVRGRAQASEATAERVPVCLVGGVLQKLYQHKTMHILLPKVKNRGRAVRARAQASEATAERVPVCLVGGALYKYSLLEGATHDFVQGNVKKKLKICKKNSKNYPKK